MSNTNISLSQIWVYPVKSLRGFRVKSWPVKPTGFLYDRQWMVVDTSGQFLSQRKLPLMALIKTALTQEHLVLSAPNKNDLLLPLSPPKSRLVQCRIWNDQCLASHVSDAADQWLGEFLQQDCHLVYMPEDVVRPVDPDFGNSGDQTAFSDGFPFLLVSENSLASLNDAMQVTMEMERFRPNLVVSGCSAYAEDSWRQICIGAIDFRLPKPCSRCSIPTIDPQTAQTGKEPLATLNRTRKWQNKVYFGQNALHNQTGTLAVGDKLTVIETGNRQPPI